MVWVLIAVGAIALDQFTKYIIVNNIDLGSSKTIIDGFFYITHIRNTGAAWSFLQNGRLVFIPVTLIVSGILVYLILKSSRNFFKLSISLILGGAVGNLIDRCTRSGGVVDFFEFHFGSYRYPVFNVADCFVVVGTILLSAYIIFIYKAKKKEEKVQE